MAALGAVALMSIAGQVLVQLSLRRQQSDAHVVNIAGRQRMLSQKLSKTLLAMQLPSDPTPHQERRREVGAIVALWERCHVGLQFGDEGLELPAENGTEIRRMFAAIEGPFQAMVVAARAAQKSDDLQEISVLARSVLSNEPGFLAGMDRIVFQYDAEANARVVRLTRIELALLTVTLVVLLLEGLFVFRPAARRLQSTIEELWDSEDKLRHEKAKVERFLAQERRQAARAS